MTTNAEPASPPGHDPVPGTPVLRDARMHLLTPASPGVGIVRSNDRCTVSRRGSGFVRHITIDVANTPLAGAFVSGQSFGVLPPGLDVTGRPHKLRLYSIASPTQGEDGQGRLLATTVKRTIDEHHDTGKLFLGVASNFLCDLAPGDEVRLTGPNGKRFVLPAEPSRHDYLFFATGTGIAPFRGMIRELLATGAPSRVVLVMGVPYAADLLYHEELRALERAHPNFTYLTALSREPQPDAAQPMYVHGRLHQARDLLGPILATERALIYICGIAGMELGIVQALARTLPPDALAQYVRAAPPVLAEVDRWERRLLHKDVHLTRRLFIEVY